MVMVKIWLCLKRHAGVFKIFDVLEEGFWIISTAEDVLLSSAGKGL
jgi:ABC-type transporter MlaC component